MKPLTLALPSKGRLMEQASALLEKAGFTIQRNGDDRLYRASLTGLEGIEVVLLSASEIATALRDGGADLGITGEDLLREAIPPEAPHVIALARLGFGPANVVVAVPEDWRDVATMSDLDDVSEGFYARHGRRLRIATKYINLTRRFFAEKGVAGYRIVPSLGATEGAPAAGTAEAIVDITTTGSTLRANRLKVLDDGLILQSEAVLAGADRLKTDPRVRRLLDQIGARAQGH